MQAPDAGLDDAWPRRARLRWTRRHRPQLELSAWGRKWTLQSHSPLPQQPAHTAVSGASATRRVCLSQCWGAHRANPFLWISRWLSRVPASTCIHVPLMPLGSAVAATSLSADLTQIPTALRCIRIVKDWRMVLLPPKFWKYTRSG